MKYLLFFLFFFTSIQASDTVRLTGLEWQDNSEAKTTKLNWQDAKEYCQNLSMAGQSDWRLPSLKELQSILDLKRFNPAIKTSFKNVAYKNYWSSTQSASDAKDVWCVYFNYGNPNSNSKSYKYYVRCVRHRQ